MARSIAILLLTASLAAATAFGQRINLRINNRGGLGGQSISAGGHIGVDNLLDPNPPTPHEIVADTCRTIRDELLATGRLSPKTAHGALGSLTHRTVAPESLRPGAKCDYYRSLSMAAAAAGNLDLARQAGRQWMNLQPRDASAIRHNLFLHFVARDRSTAAKTLAKLKAPHHKPWRPWREYMERLLPLVGARPDLGRPAGKSTVTILYFRTADGKVKPLNEPDPIDCGEHQAKLMALYKGKPVAIGDVTLDGDDGRGRAMAATLGISAAPTICVLDDDGLVLFAGDAGAWEMHAAVEFGLLTMGRRALAPPTTAEEDIAMTLHHEGWRLLRLGMKTHSPTHRRQGEAILRELIDKHPNTEGARKARFDLGRVSP